MAIGLSIGNEEKIPMMFMMLGFLVFSIGFLLGMEFILFTVHDLHTCLRKLRRAAEDLEDRDDGKTIRELVRDIEDLEPISGYGLFTVDRTTLTSTVSVMITSSSSLYSSNRRRHRHRDLAIDVKFFKCLF